LCARPGARRSARGAATVEVEKLSAGLRAEARQRGHASERVEFRGRPARLVVVPGRYAFTGLIFDDSLIEQGGFLFAKVLLVHAGVALLYALGLLLARRFRLDLLFRHRVGLVLALLSVPPVYLLAAHNSRVAEKQYEAAIHERLERRLDLAAALLREREKPVDNEWCADVAANHQVDINVYRGQDLVATSRPGVWDTGLLGRRLAAGAYVALRVDQRRDYTGREYIGSDWGLRAAYRRVGAHDGGEPLILAAPALEDRRSLERRETESNAVLLAIYLLTATTTVFVALLLGRSLTTPVRRLQEATSRVAGGELDAKLPEGRKDEFGALVRAFNRMTRELRDAQDLRVRAEKAAAWREMASQVAHEIKNPLTPIKLTVQNLLASDPETFREEFDRGAQLILDQIDALHRIAGAFSAYARFPSQEVVDVDVREILTEVADLYGADDAEVDVTAPAEPLVVRADRDELRRVLINLVTNSQQAQAKRIELRAAAEERFVRIEVIDDGAGIPPDVKERIFDPSFTTKTSGTGLGMPIVKRTVDDYGGTIELESEPGAGTRVTVRLPGA
jgi:signal transduction histidine kinase